MKINLSEYYESILSDKMIPVVLAWIEKSGSTSETEISAELGIDKNDLKHMVLKLFRNQLIDISDNFMSVSETGKYILDSLNVTDDIIKHSYINLLLKSDERKMIDKSLHWYRDSFYHDYLNTFTSLKYWDRYSHQKEDVTKEKQTLEYLLILIFDAMQLDSLNEHQNILRKNYLYFVNERVNLPEENLSFTDRAYKELLKFSQITNKEEADALPTESKRIYSFLKCKNYFIANIDKQRQLSDDLYCNNDKVAHDTFWIFTNKHAHIEHYYPAKINSGQLNPRKRLESRQSIATSMNEVIFAVENSSSISEFSTLLGKWPQDSVELLLRLRMGISELVDRENDGSYKRW